MEFENIDKRLQIKLLNICSQDKYNLSPKILYKNILYSRGSNKTLAIIFNVLVGIVKQINRDKKP